MGMVELAGAVTDPQHVAGGRVPVARGGINAGEGLFITKKQRFVASEEIRLAQARLVVSRDADRAHEVHRFADAIRQLLVTLALG
ncbi:hypothetical protein D3C86_1943430 [compost metagenome]